MEQATSRNPFDAGAKSRVERMTKTSVTGKAMTTSKSNFGKAATGVLTLFLYAALRRNANRFRNA